MADTGTEQVVEVHGLTKQRGAEGIRPAADKEDEKKKSMIKQKTSRKRPNKSIEHTHTRRDQ
jgi:hypothetical protein